MPTVATSAGEELTRCGERACSCSCLLLNNQKELPQHTFSEDSEFYIVLNRDGEERLPGLRPCPCNGVGDHLFP